MKILKLPLPILSNLIANGAWFAIVLGTAKSIFWLPWLGGAICIGLHLWWARGRPKAIAWLLFIALVGFLFDVLVAHWGLMTFTKPESPMPLWLALLLSLIHI
ncbi:MAG: DUF2878 family protein [Bdellovibrionaceae bacterium]|nr:DUF2878 family protein [Pseudobdellovibrionaceae bacterium]